MHSRSGDSIRNYCALREQAGMGLLGHRLRRFGVAEFVGAEKKKGIRNTTGLPIPSISLLFFDYLRRARTNEQATPEASNKAVAGSGVS